MKVQELLARFLSDRSFVTRWTGIARPPLKSDPEERSVEDVARNILGWDQPALAGAHALVVGLGGLGSHIAAALSRTGYGRLTLLDFDRVELSNLGRSLLSPRDIGKPKAEAVFREVLQVATGPTKCDAFQLWFSQFEPRLASDPPTAGIVAPDTDATRREVSRAFAKIGRPLVSVGLGNEGYSVLVQVPGESCIACALPEHGSGSCSVVGADYAACSAVAAAGVDALTRIIQGRTLTWRSLQYFPASGTSISGPIERRPDCSVCAQGGTT